MKKINIILLLVCQCFFANSQKNNLMQDYTWETKFPRYDFENDKLPPSYILLESLKSIHLQEKSKYLNFVFYNEKVNVSIEVKNKILSILQNNWTLEELTIAWKKYKDVAKKLDRRNLEYLTALKRTKKTNMDFDSTWIFVHDSIVNIYKPSFEESINNFIIPDKIFYIAAWSNIKEAIPLLKNLKSNKLYQDKLFEIDLSLAKLGDKKSLQFVFDSIKRFNENNEHYNPYSKDIFLPICFLNSQESIYNIISLIDTTKKSKIEKGEEGYVDVYSSIKPVIRLYSFIKNKDFQQLFIDYKIGKPHIYGEDTINAAFLLKVKEWLIKNKGKYMLDFYSMFSGTINSLDR